MADGNGIAQVPGLEDGDPAIDVAVFRETITIDGQPVEVEVQRAAIALVLPNGSTVNLGPAHPAPMADYTPPLVPIGPGGLDVAAGAEVQLVPANGGRVKLAVSHGGANGSGNVWLGFGQAATANVGEWLEPGGRWEDYFAGALRVRNTGLGTVRVTFMEWGAGA